MIPSNIAQLQLYTVIVPKDKPHCFPNLQKNSRRSIAPRESLKAAPNEPIRQGLYGAALTIKETLINAAAIDYAARKYFAAAAKLTEWGDNRFNQRFLKGAFIVSDAQTPSPQVSGNDLVSVFLK
ncbi:MAG: hypothetical protein IJ446_11075 [Oscillospiraceae bacterium]|nr:hypothetical protein [Oscillospiraceae bacterium]